MPSVPQVMMPSSQTDRSVMLYLFSPERRCKRLWALGVLSYTGSVSCTNLPLEASQMRTMPSSPAVTRPVPAPCPAVRANFLGCICMPSSGRVLMAEILPLDALTFHNVLALLELLPIMRTSETDNAPLSSAEAKSQPPGSVCRQFTGCL